MISLSPMSPNSSYPYRCIILKIHNFQTQKYILRRSFFFFLGITDHSAMFAYSQKLVQFSICIVCCCSYQYCVCRWLLSIAQFVFVCGTCVCMYVCRYMLVVLQLNLRLFGIVCCDYPLVVASVFILLNTLISMLCERCQYVFVFVYV